MQAIQGILCGAGIEPGCAEEFERPRRATSFGEVCAFDEAHAGINDSGVECGHIG